MPGRCPAVFELYPSTGGLAWGICFLSGNCLASSDQTGWLCLDDNLFGSLALHTELPANIASWDIGQSPCLDPHLWPRSTWLDLTGSIFHAPIIATFLFCSLTENKNRSNIVLESPWLLPTSLSSFPSLPLLPPSKNKFHLLKSTWRIQVPCNRSWLLLQRRT